MTVPSVPADIEMVDVDLRAYLQTPAREHMLTYPDEFQEAIRGLKFAKALVPNCIPKRELKHLPQRIVCLLAQSFNAVLLTHHFPA
jgi:hypothetical protein